MRASSPAAVSSPAPPSAARPSPTVPSRRSGPPAVPAGAPGPAVWPASTRRFAAGGEGGGDRDITVGGVSLVEAADRFGTPLYVLDEAEFRGRCRAYRAAFPDAEILYAAKAFLCRAVARWVAEEGLGLDVGSAGELGLALAAGVPAERIVLHGTAGNPEDLHTAARLGVGLVVLDGMSGIARLAAVVPPGDRQQVMVRVAPGVRAGSHPAARTGTDGRRFGLSITDGSAQHAVERIVGRPRLELVGLHCHLGSQIPAAGPYVAAVRRMVGLMARIRDRHGLELGRLDIGGGHAIAHRPGEQPLDLGVLAERVRTELAAGCARAGLAVPRLTLEPGRAVIGPAGVAVHRVLSVERTPARTFVTLDGGMGGIPRAARNGVRYAPRLIGRRSTAAPVPATVVGPHGEAGGLLAEEVPLPGDIRPGDLVAVPAAGAHHRATASDGTLVGRPPVVAVRDGAARLLVRRESPAGMSLRDVGP